jgi:hypothetical protein
MKISIRKIQINRDGYTPRGQYYGSGIPVYRCETDFGYEGEIRSVSRAGAIEMFNTDIEKKCGDISPLMKVKRGEPIPQWHAYSHRWKVDDYWMDSAAEAVRYIISYRN